MTDYHFDTTAELMSNEATDTDDRMNDICNKLAFDEYSYSVGCDISFLTEMVGRLRIELDLLERRARVTSTADADCDTLDHFSTTLAMILVLLFLQLTGATVIAVHLAGWSLDGTGFWWALAGPATGTAAAGGLLTWNRSRS